MKKEAVNTFQQGLNFDLNPITTPNNVLTDCVNGTFVTFNGDELALQNDAGNTKILVPGTTEYVKLKDGYKPIGVKEYGGVLYIVSAHDPLWYVPTNNSGETLNDMVTRLNLSSGELVCYNGSYGTLMKFFNNYSLAPFLNENNYTEEEIGRVMTSYFYSSNPDTYPNYFPAKVEIGSYPSPEFSGTNVYDGIDKKLTSGTDSGYTSISYLLYQPTIINNETFKSARCITFSNFTDIDISNISYYYFTKDVLKFYKVKLWHQLSNGFLDLTDDVVKKYNTYRNTKGLTTLTTAISQSTPVTTVSVSSTSGFSNSGSVFIGDNYVFTYTSKTDTTFVGASQTLPDCNIGENVYNTSNFWFNDANFKYYCPNQYKGKLAISIEIEELDTFELSGVPTLTYISSTESSVTLTNSTGFPDSGSVLIGSDVIPYTANSNNVLTIASQVWNSHNIGESVYFCTTLSSDISGNVTSIPVISTTGFPSSGTLIIGNDTFVYTSATTNAFTGLAQTLDSHLSGEGIGVKSISSTLGALLGARYKYQINIAYKSTNSLIPASYVNFELYYGNKQIDSTNIAVTNDLAAYTYYLSESVYREKVVSYIAHPEWLTNFTYSDFPSEWQSKFNLSGNRLISTSTDKVAFTLYEGSCSSTTIGIKNYSKVLLTDQSGNNIDKDQNLTAEQKWVFILSGSGSTLGTNENLLGYYNIDSYGYPQVDMTTIISGLSDSIIQLFQQMKVSVYDITCDIQTVDFTFMGVYDSSNITLNTNIRVIQNNNTLSIYHKENDTVSSPGIYDCHVDVNPGVPFRIIANVSGYEVVDITRTITSGGVLSFNLAMVQSMSYFESVDTSIPNRVSYSLTQVWFPGSIYFYSHDSSTDGTVTVNYGINTTSATLYTCGHLSSGKYYQGTAENNILGTQTFLTSEDNKPTWTITLNLDISNALDSGYYTNITAESDYVEISNMIYKKQYTI